MLSHSKVLVNATTVMHKTWRGSEAILGCQPRARHVDLFPAESVRDGNPRIKFEDGTPAKRRFTVFRYRISTVPGVDPRKKDFFSDRDVTAARYIQAGRPPF